MGSSGAGGPADPSGSAASPPALPAAPGSSARPARSPGPGASVAKRLADAVLERRRLPPELLLRARRVGLRVPQQELELATRDQRRDAETIREEVAERGGGTGCGQRHRRRHAPAPGDTHDGLGQLAQGAVLVAEDVALAVAPALRGQEGPGGDAALVDDAHATRRHRRHATAGPPAENPL